MQKTYENISQLLKTNGVEDNSDRLFWCSLNHGGPESVKLIEKSISTGAKILSKDKSGNTPLMQIILSDYRDDASTTGETIRFLLKHGASVNEKNPKGATALLLASEMEREEKSLIIVRMLLSSGAKTNASDADGTSPLMVAVKNNHLELAKLLIKNGAKINATDNWGLTPIFYAFSKKSCSIEAAQLLRRHNANLNHRDKSGLTILSHINTCGEGTASIYDEVLALGIRKSDSDKLLEVLRANEPEKVESAIKAGAGVYLKKANSLLLFHAWKPEETEILIRYGANPNTRNQQGRTALMDYLETCISQYPDCSEETAIKTIEFHLNAKYDKSIKDTQGQTAYAITKKALENRTFGSNILSRLNPALNVQPQIEAKK